MTPREMLILGAMILAVYLPKTLPLFLVSDRLPAGVRRWLHYVAPAVLSALVAPAVLAPSGRLAAPGWDQAGYLAAFLVAVLTRRVIPALVAGLAVVIAVTALTP